jgi:hypothetical protein
MSENTEAVLEATQGATEQTTKKSAPMSYDDGVIRVNLNELNKPQENAVSKQETNAGYDTVEQPKNTQSSKDVVKEVREPIQEELQSVQNEESVIEEITDEQIQEQVEELQEEVEEEIQQARDTGNPLPENIQKVVEFMNETGGSLEDYVKLNTDYSSLNEMQLIKEYYETTKPHLDSEDIDLLMEEFSYDEDLDEPKEIRKAKIAFKEEAAKAKNYLDGLKSKYYEEIKAGSKLNPEQQKAVEFFNRYKKNNEESTKIAEHQVSVFKNKTETLFSNDFKGFDFNVGEKKFRFKVNNVDQVKTTQSDINNFVKKFLNEKNEMKDAAGYHKSLFTAMNADAIANHFYEQGKTDAIKNSMAKAKNIDMDPRGAHENVNASNGWTVRAISNSASSSKLKIKSKR